MPELPEVEFGRKVAAAVARGRRITRVRCAEDRIVFDGVAPATVKKKLEGRRVLEVHRHGKQLWMELDRPPHPLFHFGMTGAFRVPGGDPLELEAGLRDSGDWPPRFTKIHLEFDDGGELVMTNARRLGRIRLRERPREEPPIARLGFDPLLGMPAPDVFSERLRRRKRRLKSVLLDQSFCAGVGNWIADEVLYRAGIDPRRRASDLDDREARRIGRALEDIVAKAVAVDARKSKYPRTWLFHRRWGKQRNARTVQGEAIEFIEVGGRTTAFVPSRQC